MFCAVIHIRPFANRMVSNFRTAFAFELQIDGYNFNCPNRKNVGGAFFYFIPLLLRLHYNEHNLSLKPFGIASVKMYAAAARHNQDGSLAL